MARWDDPLNRSINVVLGKDPKTRPAYGRVNGVGINEKWDTHYPEDRELARQRRRAGRASFESRLAGMREELKEEMREEVEVKAKAMATAQVMEMWPDLIEAVKRSLASGQTAPPSSSVSSPQPPTGTPSTSSRGRPACAARSSASSGNPCPRRPPTPRSSWPTSRLRQQPHGRPLCRARGSARRCGYRPGR